MSSSRVVGLALLAAWDFGVIGAPRFHGPVSHPLGCRKTAAGTIFVAGENRASEEDKGFAIALYSKVRFENADIVLKEDRAIAMGNYFYVDGDDAKVEYIFGYKMVDGKLKINLNYSSFPYVRPKEIV